VWTNTDLKPNAHGSMLLKNERVQWNISNTVALPTGAQAHATIACLSASLWHRCFLLGPPQVIGIDHTVSFISKHRHTLWKPQEATMFFCVLDCWLVVTRHVYSVSPATGHLATGFLAFPLFLSKFWNGSQVQSCYCMLLMQPSRSILIKLIPILWRKPDYLSFQIIHFTTNQNIRISLSVWSYCFVTPKHLHFYTTLTARTSGRSLGTL
jgi:hypothetical protein